MPASPTIAFIDSGIGGLPYLRHLRQALPGASYAYVADNRNFPYGTKSADEVCAAAVDMTERLLRRYDPALVVVACNTASMHALDALRRRFPYDFVGVVPAVKPAARLSRSRSIGVMASERALIGDYFDRLVAEHAADCRVVRYPATELIRAIETDPFMEDRQAYLDLMSDIRACFRSQSVDTIVLGCTHFLHVDRELRAVFGDEFALLDSREGVSRQTMRRLQALGVLDGLRRADPAAAAGSFHLTAPDPSPLYPKVAAAFGLAFGGDLP